jgi:hypothetical protein
MEEKEETHSARAFSPVVCKNCAALMAKWCYRGHWWFRLVREPLLAGMRVLAWWNGIDARTHGVRNPECYACVRFMRAELDEKSPTFRFLYKVIGQRVSDLRNSLLTREEIEEAKRHAREMMGAKEGK